MPGVKKLSWFRKLIIGLGKRLYFRKSEKVNVLGMGLMLRELLRNYQEFLGSLEDALAEFESEVQVQATEVITNLLYEPIMMGVSMSYTLSQDLKDGPFTTQAMIYGIIGKNYKKVFSYPQMILYEDGSGEAIVRMKQCIMCASITDVTKEDLGTQNYGNCVATLFGTAINEGWKYLGLPYEVVEAKETMCFLRGDPYGEFTIKFVRKS